MSESNATRHLVRTVRLADDAVGRLLDNLDATDDSSHPERRSRRYPYRIKALVVKLQQPGAADPVSYRAPSRGLSAGGLSFLHGGFVHTGSRCLVQLITSHGSWNDVVGTVVGCRHVEGSVHEVSVKFDKSLDPSAYCAEAIQSRVLVADDDASIQRLATFHLEQLSAEVDQVENGRMAVERALKKAYDIILMDVEMPVMDGLEHFSIIWTGPADDSSARMAGEPRHEAVFDGFAGASGGGV